MTKTAALTSAAAVLLAGPASFAFAAPVAAAPYIKVCNSGAQAGSGTCPASPVFGAQPTNWACTIDQATNLMWEVKSPDAVSPRFYGRTFTNFDNAAVAQKSNGQFPTAAEISSANNVIGYLTMLNTQSLCGKAGWRRPTYGELNGLVLGTAAPTINSAMFPNTVPPPLAAYPYTTSTPAAGSPKDKLYMVSFNTGQAVMWPRDHPSRVRLVTAAPVVAARPDCGIGSTVPGTPCYGYLIQQNGYYPGHFQNSYSFSTLPASYPAVVRCERPAPLLNLTAPGNVKCMRKYEWVKPTPPTTMNGSTQVTNPPSSVEVFPPN
jgi:hypothetical protein